MSAPIAWHGWAAAELVAALGVLAVVAGALSDTAKAYSTEKRVNELARRHSSQVHVSATGWSVSDNAGSGAISGDATRSRPSASPSGREYEIYVEGDGTWGSAGIRQNLTPVCSAGTPVLAPRSSTCIAIAGARGRAIVRLLDARHGHRRAVAGTTATVIGSTPRRDLWQ